MRRKRKSYIKKGKLRDKGMMYLYIKGREYYKAQNLNMHT